MTGNGESAVRLFSGARVFTASARRWADAMVVVGERIAYVGDETTARSIAGRAAVGKDLVVTDFDGALVLPGFVDAHAHVISTGETRGHVDLWGTTTLVEVQQRIAAGARDRLGAQRIRAHGWQHAALPGGRPTRQQLDAVVSDRPVYAQAYDFHSMWLNSAALAELGIGPQTPDTAGGRIHRDDAGEATGYIDETAMHRYVWPFLERSVTDDERDEHLASALNGYRAAGVTAVTDIGLDEHDLAAMARAEHGGRLTARIVGHWRIQPTGDAAQNLAQVARARELAARHTSPWLRVTGIKVMVDGTVDGCTAALGH
ncbi:MAG: amidohydrolase, partial [Janthinobacterium lividum]